MNIPIQTYFAMNEIITYNACVSAYLDKKKKKKSYIMNISLLIDEEQCILWM